MKCNEKGKNKSKRKLTRSSKSEDRKASKEKEKNHLNPEYGPSLLKAEGGKFDILLRALYFIGTKPLPRGFAEAGAYGLS